MLGVAFAIKGLMGFVVVLFRLALSARFGDVLFRTLVWQNGADVLVQIVQFGAGVGLTLGARGLTGLLNGLRERGPPPTSPDGDPERPPS